MKRIVTHPILCHLPFYLETPNDLDGYKAEIELLRDFCVTVKGRNYMTFPALMTVLARLLPTR